MNELEYQAQLDAVAEYLTLWRVGPTVRAAIRSAPPRGPGYTGGGGARAVCVLPKCRCEVPQAIAAFAHALLWVIAALPI